MTTEGYSDTEMPRLPSRVLTFIHVLDTGSVALMYATLTLASGL